MRTSLSRKLDIEFLNGFTILNSHNPSLLERSSMKSPSTKFSAFLALLALVGCDRSESVSQSSTPSITDHGKVAVSVKLGAVGVLARSAQMTPTKLVLQFTSNQSSTVRDTILISGNGTVAKSYDLASQQNWTLQATGLDQRDSVLYTGSSTFNVLAQKTTNVNLSLDARYSSLRVRFPVRDSLTRFVLSVDGAVWGDSSVVYQARLGDTVKMEHDYLAASPAGTLHAFSLKVFGRQWGLDTLFYAFDTSLNIVSGSNLGRTLTLKWVGLKSPPPGMATLSVTLGTVGQVEIGVGYQDTSTVVASNIVVGSNFPSGLSFSQTYRVHLWVDPSVDTTGLLIRYTIDGSLPTATSTIFDRGVGVSFGSSIRLQASPWRNGLAVGPVQVFDWNVATSNYNFNAPDSDALYAPDSNIAKKTGQFIAGWATVTGTASFSNPVSTIATGNEVKLSYSIDGSNYPSAGFQVMTPFNPVYGASLQNYGALKSISLTLRSTLTGNNLSSTVRVAIVPTMLDTASFAFGNVGIDYGWEVNNATAGAVRVTLPISSAHLPSWATSVPPTTVSQQLAELFAIKLEVSCKTSTCIKQLGTLEVDDLTFQF